MVDDVRRRVQQDMLPKLQRSWVEAANLLIKTVKRTGQGGLIPMKGRALGKRAALGRILRSTPILLVGLWALWGSAFIGIKIGLMSAGPIAFAALRVAVATLGLGLFLVASGTEWGEATQDSSGLHKYALFLGTVQVCAYFMLQNLGMVEVDAGVAAVLIYTQPLIVAGAARVILGERLRRGQLLGIFVGWLGIIALVSSELTVGRAGLPSLGLLLLGATAWASGTVLFKLIPTTVPLVPLLFLMNAYGLPLLLFFAVLEGDSMEMGVYLIMATLWTGVGAGIGGIGLQFALLRRGEASVVSTWMFAVPIVSAGLGIIVLGERLHAGIYVGGCLVATGIYLVNTGRSPIIGRVADDNVEPPSLHQSRESTNQWKGR